MTICISTWADNTKCDLHRIVIGIDWSSSYTHYNYHLQLKVSLTIISINNVWPKLNTTGGHWLHKTIFFFTHIILLSLGFSETIKQCLIQFKYFHILDVKIFEFIDFHILNEVRASILIHSLYKVKTIISSRPALRLLFSLVQVSIPKRKLWTKAEH